MDKQIAVLLVDDEPRFLGTTGKLLERLGFRVLTVASGKGALALLADNAVDVVVLDMKMPGMDGIETLKAIKRDHPMVEAILLTGHATVEAAVEGLQNGAFDFLMKPADITDLVDKVEAAFERRRAQQRKIRGACLRRNGIPEGLD